MGPRGRFYSCNLCWDRLCTGYVSQVELPVRRRLCPIFVRNVGSPDIHECFRRLTGSQRTPGFWGITEQANAVDQYKPPATTPYSNTYNPNWRNHPNLSWKPKPPPYVPPAAQQQHGSSAQPQPPPSSSLVEQAIMNLSKVVGNFVEEQKAANA